MFADAGFSLAAGSTDRDRRLEGRMRRRAGGRASGRAPGGQTTAPRYEVGQPREALLAPPPTPVLPPPPPLLYHHHQPPQAGASAAASSFSRSPYRSVARSTPRGKDCKIGGGERRVERVEKNSFLWCLTSQHIKGRS